MIIFHDEQFAQAQRVVHRLACPDCGGRLRKHGFSRPRWVRTRGGGRRRLRPARARCTGPACRRTHVLLPAWCVPGRADDADTIGSALLAAATGEGYRPIAERLKVPQGTVRGWLRAARAHTDWLYQAGASMLHVVDHDDPVIPPSGRSPLWHAVEGARRRRGSAKTLLRGRATHLGLGADGAHHRRPPAAARAHSFRLNWRAIASVDSHRSGMIVCKEKLLWVRHVGSSRLSLRPRP